MVTIVDNGEAALDALERGGFDLALFDLSMPVVSGLEALKLYRFSTPHADPGADPVGQRDDRGDRRVRARRAPPSSCRKPLRASLLLDAIERHLADVERPAPPVPARADDRPALSVVDTPPLDPTVLEDLARLSKDPTFVERLLRGFKGDTERLVREIGDALGARRYEAAKDAAHALRGGSASVGAMQLLQIATRIDKASHDTLRLKASAVDRGTHGGGEQRPARPRQASRGAQARGTRRRRRLSAVAHAVARPPRLRRDSPDSRVNREGAGPTPTPSLDAPSGGAHVAGTPAPRRRARLHDPASLDPTVDRAIAYGPTPAPPTRSAPIRVRPADAVATAPRRRALIASCVRAAAACRDVSRPRRPPATRRSNPRMPRAIVDPLLRADEPVHHLEVALGQAQRGVRPQLDDAHELVVRRADSLSFAIASMPRRPLPARWCLRT